MFSTQTAAISCLKGLNFISNTNSMYKRNYSFRTDWIL